MSLTPVTTRARLLRPLASVMLAAAMCAPVLLAEDGGAKADANFPNADQAKNYLAEGVQQYRTGRYKEAGLAFRNALALEPDNKLVYEFYLACGDALVVRMQEQDVLDGVLKDVLRRARIYQKQMRQDPAYIKLLIGKLDKSEEERVVATNELAAVGPRAVPHLMAAMSDTPQEERRTYCRVVLTKMGGRAVLPLTVALASKDQRQLRSIALVLGDLGDDRALPALLSTQTREGLEDATKATLTAAIAAIKDAAKIADLGSAEDRYLLEARRYFSGGPKVQDEMLAAGALVWRWDESKQGAEQLQFVRTASYAWNELIAEELIFAGMAAYPKTPGFQPLLAAAYAAQATEVDSRSRLAKERTSPAVLPEDNADALAERVQALGEAASRVRMAGADNICRAIQFAIADGRGDVAANLIRILNDRDLAHPDQILPSPEKGLSADKPGSVLIQALDSPDKQVRYEAAITLAGLDPMSGKAIDMATLRSSLAQLTESIKKDTERRSGELIAQVNQQVATQTGNGFLGAEKVVPVLAQAVGESSMRVVLVVEPDYRQRNAARAALQSKGYMVVTAADGFEAVNRLAESPTKDAVIVSGDLGPSVKDEHGTLIDVPQQTALGLVKMMSTDPRLSGAPIFVSLPDNPARAAEVQGAFDGKLPEGGAFVAKPFDAVELNEKIDAQLKKANAASPAQAATEDLALRACQALERPDPLRTQMDLGAAADALVGTLASRSDAIRIEALKAIGHAAATGKLKGQIAKITDAYGNLEAELEKNPQLRCAFLYAIGQVDPTTEAAVGILKKALTHADAGVRMAAAAAVGASPAVAPDLLATYQQQQRIDTRAAGAGKD